MSDRGTGCYLDKTHKFCHEWQQNLWCVGKQKVPTLEQYARAVKWL